MFFWSDHPASYAQWTLLFQSVKQSPSKLQELAFLHMFPEISIIGVKEELLKRKTKVCSSKLW